MGVALCGTGFMFMLHFNVLRCNKNNNFANCKTCQAFVVPLTNLILNHVLLLLQPSLPIWFLRFILIHLSICLSCLVSIHSVVCVCCVLLSSVNYEYVDSKTLTVLKVILVNVTSKTQILCPMQVVL